MAKTTSAKRAQRNKKIITYHKQGLSKPKIARKFKIAPATVAMVLGKAGLIRKKTPHEIALRYARETKVIEALKEGIPMRQIAAQNNITGAMVHFYARKAGLETSWTTQWGKTIQKVVRDFKTGKSVAQLSNQYDILPNTICKYVVREFKKYALSLNKHVALRNNTMYQYYTQGLSIGRLKILFNISLQEAYDILKPYGIEKKPSATRKYIKQVPYILQELNKGATLKKIAAKLNTQRFVIWRIGRNYGFKLTKEEVLALRRNKKQKN